MNDLTQPQDLKRFSVELTERPDGTFGVVVANDAADDDLKLLAGALCQVALDLYEQSRADAH
ncbi:hypothetical protein [Salinicola rhizosphaerae]|uniref:Uncharacterized protein n=1 Tax=Salinicola rhizosphaerae TaxID=1443141 RepID=A0ABQ3DPH8_9GAMM|nr:hypothetical protein [Salinicola rhizosphaerae]GHB06881.1 hypothetical protein GCM10009038_00040 [Salinicola rhizosphaerae]